MLLLCSYYQCFSSGPICSPICSSTIFLVNGSNDTVSANNLNVGGTNVDTDTVDTDTDTNITYYNWSLCYFSSSNLNISFEYF